MDNLIGFLLLGLRIASALALYFFLFVSLYLLWQSLKNSVQAQITATIPTLIVQPLNLPGLPESFRFSQGEVRLGREPGCEMIIPHETISARHARFHFSQNQWWIEDLNSRNGTRVNGLVIEAPLVLTSMDEIQLGEVVFTVFIEGAAP